MLLPLSIMQFKQGEYAKCDKTIKAIEEANEYLYKVLKNMDIISFDDKKEDEMFMQGYYQIGSKAEAAMILDKLAYLIMSTPAFIEYFINKFDN